MEFQICQFVPSSLSSLVVEGKLKAKVVGMKVFVAIGVRSNQHQFISFESEETQSQECYTT